jgi:hypothetical protein
MYSFIRIEVLLLAKAVLPPKLRILEGRRVSCTSISTLNSVPQFPKTTMQGKETVTGALYSTVLHCYWRSRWRGSWKARSMQCTFTYNLCSAHDRLHGIPQRDPGPRQRPRHLDEAGKDSRPDAIELAALGATTALRELDLARVERAPELGHERAVERVCGWTRGGGGAVQHARELVGVFEHCARAEWVFGVIAEEF